jgi:SAM-dependent methyltransferase
MVFTGYATPRTVNDLDECFFYHTTELPGVGLIPGLWDLRGRVNEYLGHVALSGQRVLELGSASGFLTFEMERQGAEVVGYDLSEEQEWDSVPYAALEMSKEVDRRKEHIRKLNNSFWLSHSLMDSKARMIYGSVYSVPPEAGPFDVAVFGSILLHLRDPFLALQQSLRLTRRTAVITDMRSRWSLPIAGRLRRLLPRPIRRPAASFVPDPERNWPTDTWWRLNPEVITTFLGVLGFEQARVTYHTQVFQGRRLPLFTVVGERTKGKALEY